MEKPITPKIHGAIDYGLTLSLLTVPRLLNFSPRARKVFSALGLTAGTVNAVTAQPLAVKPVISFKTHRMVDLASLPVFSLLPVFTGVAKEPRARVLWLTAVGGIVAVYALTDWDADSSY